MKTGRLSIFSILFTGMAFVFYFNTTLAQDAAEVDPEHYKVEFENDQVRVLRITYGPGEKSVMHYHPESMVVFLTDGNGKFTFPDGTTEDSKFEAGLFLWMPEVTHQPENTGKEPFELIQIEMKKIDDD
jgi:mannose-6-phosphate isomerase-like protein (cupin superfamily)